VPWINTTIKENLKYYINTAGNACVAYNNIRYALASSFLATRFLR
jgi:hypothetical protein